MLGWSCSISTWKTSHGWRRAYHLTRPIWPTRSPASICRATIFSSPRSSLSASVPWSGSSSLAFLFHPSFGEVEESEIGEHLRLANLRFEDWFEPFANVPYVHPYVADTSRSPHQSHGCPPQSDGEEARSVEEFVEETWNERANIG